MAHMLPTSTAIERYFMENLGMSVSLHRWPSEDRIPLLLRDTYLFFECMLLGIPWLVLCDRGPEERSPATIRKHLAMLRDKWHGELMYVHPFISTYNRKRLIEQKVPFIVPGRQMYLPQLGIDLREHIRKLQRVRSASFRPSTQVVLLHALYHPDRHFTPTSYAQHLGYSNMTLTRVFDELEAAGVISTTSQGKERAAKFLLSRRSAWERALPFLRSPVRRRAAVLFSGSRPPGVLAGLSALSHFGMLVPPESTVYAVSGKTWKTAMKSGELRVIPMAESGSLELEIWRYTPSLLTAHDIADPLSVYLSLRDSDDERVEIALEALLESVKW
ncbi:MAG: hypothetical protein KFH87_12370 [Bacteroidetes bacterium]|nr:hypothetical protein [Bacteroidota bacterium]